MSLLIVLGAMLPLVVVGVTNLILTFLVPRAYGAKHEVVLGGHPIVLRSARWRPYGQSRARCSLV
jgi:hypothetical protein